MAETLDLLRSRRDATAELARLADMAAERGEPGATLQAEKHHRDLLLIEQRIARMEVEHEHAE